MPLRAPFSRGWPFGAQRHVAARHARHSGSLDSIHLARLRFAAAIIASIALLLFAMPERTSAQGFTVGVRVNCATGAGPISVAIGDLNGDGNADLVVTNYLDDKVSVLLGNGRGGFGSKADFPTGSIPWTVAIGDLNGDGKRDLAVADFGSGMVSVLLGNGAGGFGPKADFATGGNPRSVAIGDLNGDGKLDLAVLAQANSVLVVSSYVAVQFGSGGGSFAGTAAQITGTDSATDLAVSDLNGDGKLDLLVTLPAGPTPFYGNGAGQFSTTAP